MTTGATSGAPLLSPETVHELLVQPVLSLSIAAQVANYVPITTASIRFPVVTADPSAQWVAEGQEIPPSDMGLSEVDVVPPKVAGLSIITRELADDTSPQAAQVVGDGLARDIARKVDAAFFGKLAAPAPAGLGSLTGVTVVRGLFAAPNDLDPFTQAVFAVEQQSADVTAWVANPTDALKIATFKTTDGGRMSLLSSDPTQPARRIIEGRPLLISTAVAAGSVWGIPGDRVHLVVRDDARIEADRSVLFTSDRVAVKGTARIGFGFVHQAAIVRVTSATA